MSRPVHAEAGRACSYSPVRTGRDTRSTPYGVPKRGSVSGRPGDVTDRARFNDRFWEEVGTGHAIQASIGYRCERRAVPPHLSPMRVLYLRPERPEEACGGRAGLGVPCGTGRRAGRIRRRAGAPALQKWYRKAGWSPHGAGRRGADAHRPHTGGRPRTRKRAGREASGGTEQGLGWVGQGMRQARQTRSAGRRRRAADRRLASAGSASGPRAARCRRVRRKLRAERVR